jgi:hypothetical protein
MPLKSYDDTRKSKKFGDIGRSLRRDHIVSIWTTSYIHNTMSKIANTKGVTVSSLGHRYFVEGIKNEDINNLSDLEKRVAYAESERRDAEDERMAAQRTTEIASLPDDVKRYCEIGINKGMPVDIIIDEVIDPNIKSMQRVDSKAARWAIERLEELKKSYKEKEDE